MTRALKLPPGLDSLPRLSYSTKPKPAGEPDRVDKVYGIRSTDQLVREFEIREGRLKVIAADRVRNREIGKAVGVLALLAVVLLAVALAAYFGGAPR